MLRLQHRRHVSNSSRVTYENGKIGRVLTTVRVSMTVVDYTGDWYVSIEKLHLNLLDLIGHLYIH